MTQWKPDLYLKFERERTRPARDLAQNVKEILQGQGAQGLHILDLGCGPGNSTRVLHQMFPGAELVGLDSSPEMIEKAKTTEVPAEWIVSDALTWNPPKRFDLVFSNAVAQWFPDHQGALESFWNWLNPGGVLAFQVPAIQDSFLHKALLAVADSLPWSNYFSDNLWINWREPEAWLKILENLEGVQAHGADVWTTSYYHILRGHKDLLDWYAGTGMLPWLKALPDEKHRQGFQDQVLSEIEKVYPLRQDGSVIFPFRRIFFTVSKV